MKFQGGLGTCAARGGKRGIRVYSNSPTERVIRESLLITPRATSDLDSGSLHSDTRGGEEALTILAPRGYRGSVDGFGTRMSSGGTRDMRPYWNSLSGRATRGCPRIIPKTATHLAAG